MPRLIIFNTWLVAFSLTATVQAQDLLPKERSIAEAFDHYINAKLKDEKIKPAKQADDAAILRRITLDLVGRIPTASEVDAYLADKSADRKVKLVDRLLQSPGFVRHQSQELLTLLDYENPSRRVQTDLQNYLKTAVAENRSWDQMFRDMMLPDPGDKEHKGADGFLKTRVKDLDRMTIDVSSLFFGVNVSCAQCHDHPHVLAWTQDHFYGMKSFLARTYDANGFIAERAFGVVKYTPNKGKQKVAPVMFLTGKAFDDLPGLKDPSKEDQKREKDRLAKSKKSKKPPEPPEFSIRAKLVETALEPGQREFFARAIVNRFIYRLFGRGLVMPLDQMHTENRPSHPELLGWLARDFIDHGYDLKRLTRGLLLSQTYARSTRWEGTDYPSDRLFAMGNVRALTPSQMTASLKIASTDPDSIDSLGKDANKFEARIEALERSISRFGNLFQQPGEDFQVSVSEAMLFANNEDLLRSLLVGNDSLPKRLQQIADPAKKAELAVRTVLSRPAQPAEIDAISSYLRERGERTDDACQQIVWALLTSAEFRFNH